MTNCSENLPLQIKIYVFKSIIELKDEVKHINCSVTLLLFIFMQSCFECLTEKSSC